MNHPDDATSTERLTLSLPPKPARYNVNIVEILFFCLKRAVTIIENV